MTVKITKELIEKNIVIVSGMAKGIDSIAHKVCIENNKKTIAILGSGLKNIYPKENTKLFYQIIESDGLVLSEYPMEEPVQKKNFSKRNRIISGLAEGVVVIEGAYRSGTSITARNAILQGKKLFYVPNCVGNKNSYESVKLAKDGAIIATCGADILNEIGVNSKNTYELNLQRKNKELWGIISDMEDYDRRIFLCLKEHGNMDSNQISTVTGISIIKVNQILTNLELNNVINSEGLNRYKVREDFCE